MADRTTDALEALLRESLAVWHKPGEVRQAADRTISVRTALATLTIRRAPPGLPFRWIVEMMGRERGAASISGVLRLVRKALDAEYVPYPARIAPLPEVTP